MIHTTFTRTNRPEWGNREALVTRSQSGRPRLNIVQGSRRGRGRGGGGGNGRDNGQGKSKSKGRDVWASSERQSYQDIVKENKLFEKYYHELGLMSGEEETAEFWSTLRRELPNSFRFCGSKG